jgi:hypothetical protein
VWRLLFSAIDDIMRHPMTLLVIGFGLTAGIGGWIQNRQHNTEAARIETANAMSAIARILESSSDYILQMQSVNGMLII